MPKLEDIESAFMTNSQTPITDALIYKVMKNHPGVSKLQQSIYYEEVHQELAPLARSFEMQITELKKIIQKLRQQSAAATASINR